MLQAFQGYEFLPFFHASLDHTGKKDEIELLFDFMMEKQKFFVQSLARKFIQLWFYTEL